MTQVIGDVDGKIAVMSDDIIVTGGTLIAGAKALKEAGATEVYACATHGLFPGNSFEKIQASELREVTVTNTVPIDPLKQPDKVKVVTGLEAPGRDDPERLLGRVGVGDLRRREPALLEKM